jgi:N-acetylneuraminic acid mutarotase
MRKNIKAGFLIAMGLILSACGLGKPQIATVEVTRVVPQTQIVTAEVTRRETQIITIEVTRIVRETAIPIPVPLSSAFVDVSQGIALTLPRTLHTATRLLDGRILLVGGSQASDEDLVAVDIVDPAMGTITQAAPLHTPRHDHTATLLLDGRVLVVGGYSLPRGWLDDAEVYDPFMNTWTVVPPHDSHGVQHTATLMKDGRVLVVGGTIRSGPGIAGTERVEIFDPQTNSWTEARSLKGDRGSHTAQLLNDGRVLVAGGGGGINAPPAGGDALLYDPQANTWTATGPMVKLPIYAESVRLPDGRILVVGGINFEDLATQKMSASAQIYDPVSNIWTAVANLSEARYAFVLALLPNGLVLAVGGAREYDTVWNEASFVHEVESYDPVANRWHLAGLLPRPGANSAAAVLPDGRLWLTGGQAGRPSATYLPDTWLIAPG